MWTEKEVDLLKKYYPTGGKIECSKYINRTQGAIATKAKRLKIRNTVISRKDGWSIEDLDFLREWYPLEGSKACAQVLDRSPSAIITKAGHLGLKSNHKWTEEETQILIDNYSIIGSKGCSKLIGRTPNAIKDQANKLAIKGSNIDWSIEEEGVLKTNYESKGPEYCGTILNRSYNAIKLHAQKLNITYIGITNEELLIIIKEAAGTSSTISAKQLREISKYTSTIIHRFGGWNSALIAAGLALNSNDGTSTPEKDLFLELEKIYIGEMLSGDRKILKGKELDIVLPELKLAIEFNGLYWHSEVHKDKNYHLNKTKEAAKAGYRLIHIFEHEWLNKREIVLSRLSSLIGSSSTLYARKCEIREVSSPDSAAFLELSHIQGNAKGSVRLGLYYNEELVALQTFCKSRLSTKYQWELLRYCNKLGFSVVGGASRLFKYFIKNYEPKSVVSYSDLRWNTGNLYTKLGFELSHISKPNYWYFKGLKVESRMKYQKHKLNDVLSYFDSSKTEYENMLANGFNKFFDCGNNVYVWNRFSEPG